MRCRRTLAAAMTLVGCLASPPAAEERCGTQFSILPAYELCSEEPGSCQFFVHFAQVTTCSEVCTLADADCVSSADSEPQTECQLSAEGSCFELRTSQTCKCTRGTGSLTDAAPTEACDDAFNDLPDYRLCRQEGDVCVVFATTGGETCQQICESAGTTCVGSRDADLGADCQPFTGEEHCTAIHGDQMCWCDRP